MIIENMLHNLTLVVFIVKSYITNWNAFENNLEKQATKFFCHSCIKPKCWQIFQIVLLAHRTLSF